MTKPFVIAGRAEPNQHGVTESSKLVFEILLHILYSVLEYSVTRRTVVKSR
jgi:hypothetical protein